MILITKKDLLPARNYKVYDNNKNQIYNSGVYILYDINDNVIYIGQSKNINNRLLCHCNNLNSNWKYALILFVEHNEHRHILEIFLINYCNPKNNKQRPSSTNAAQDFYFNCIKNQKATELYKNFKKMKKEQEEINNIYMCL